MVNLLSAEDPLVRAGLRTILAESYGAAHIGEAASGAQTLEMLQAGGWDVLILDVSMPDRNGIDILREVRTSHPSVKVLVLSVFPERQYALNVIKGGASGYLTRQCARRAAHALGSARGSPFRSRQRDPQRRRA